MNNTRPLNLLPACSSKDSRGVLNFQEEIVQRHPHLGMLPARVAAKVAVPSGVVALPRFPLQAAVAHLRRPIRYKVHSIRSEYEALVGGEGSKWSGGALTSWKREREGWVTRGCAEWRTSPVAMGRVAKTPRPAESVKATRTGGGPRPAATAAAVERRRRRTRDIQECREEISPVQLIFSLLV